MEKTLRSDARTSYWHVYSARTFAWLRRWVSESEGCPPWSLLLRLFHRLMVAVNMSLMSLDRKLLAFGLYGWQRFW